jgi:DivIVA domain-containing protein
MTDSGFHVTPIDIRSQEFHRTLRGYDPAAVDEFRERVAEELELLQFREQLTAFRERERALNEALVAAQQLRADMEQAARREADIILREARGEAERTVQEARAGVLAVRRDMEATQRQFAAYLGAFRTLLERYLSEVDALEAHRQDGSPPLAT